MWAWWLLACGGGDPADTDRSDTDALSETCAAVPERDLGLTLCLETDDRGLPPRGDGAFVSWTDDGQGTFVAANGIAWGVWHSVGADLRPHFPDLVAAGEVTVLVEGEPCVGEGSTFALVIHRRGDPGDLLLATGTRDTTVSGWMVAMVPQDPPCPSRPDDGCSETVANQAVRFERSGVVQELPQATLLLDGGSALVAHTAQRATSPSHCDDGPAATQMSWSILPAP